MFATLFFLARSVVWPRLRNWSRRAFELRPLVRLIGIGAPVGGQLCLEFGAFGMTLSMMGWISVSALAGHQAAITLASMTYMVPLGLSVATGVRVGDAVGRGDPTGARWSAGLGFLLGAGVMVCFALVFLLFPLPLAALFTGPQAIGARQVTLALLPIAAAFQVMDGVQVVALGALRGIADTQVPMWINLGGFWVLGIPAGAWLAFYWDLGPAGLWWGLTIGLTAVAIALAWRTWSALGGELARRHIDEDD
jgi:MATE family multidrug resistance protein